MSASKLSNLIAIPMPAHFRTFLSLKTLNNPDRSKLYQNAKEVTLKKLIRFPYLLFESRSAASRKSPAIAGSSISSAE